MIFTRRRAWSTGKPPHSTSLVGLAFSVEVEATIGRILEAPRRWRQIEQDVHSWNPRRFHIISGVLRRANFPSFPYHLLYREIEGGARS